MTYACDGAITCSETGGDFLCGTVSRERRYMYGKARREAAEATARAEAKAEATQRVYA